MSTLFDTLGWCDIVFKNNLKPWWETILSFSVVLTAITAFVLSCISDTEFLRCIPGNETQVSNFSMTQAAFVNKACFREVDYLLRNFQWLSVVAAGLIFIANNFWLYIPQVGEAIFHFVGVCDLYKKFKTPVNKAFRECQDMNKIFKEHETLDGVKKLLKAISNQKCPSEEDTERLTLLDKESEVQLVHSSTFRNCYFGRNLVSLLVNVAVVVCLILMGISGIWVNIDSFPCRPKKQPSYVSGTFICLYTTFDLMYAAWIALMLSSLTQIVIQSFLLISCSNYTDLQLILKFAQNAAEKEPLKDFKQFCSDVHENENIIKTLLEHEIPVTTDSSQNTELMKRGTRAREIFSSQVCTKTSPATTKDTHETVVLDDTGSGPGNGVQCSTQNEHGVNLIFAIPSTTKSSEKNENNAKSVSSEAKCSNSVNLVSSPHTQDWHYQEQNTSSRKEHSRGYTNVTFGYGDGQESNKKQSPSES